MDIAERDVPAFEQELEGWSWYWEFRHDCVRYWRTLGGGGAMCGLYMGNRAPHPNADDEGGYKCPLGEDYAKSLYMAPNHPPVPEMTWEVHTAIHATWLKGAERDTLATCRVGSFEVNLLRWHSAGGDQTVYIRDLDPRPWGNPEEVKII